MERCREVLALTWKDPALRNVILILSFSLPFLWVSQALAAMTTAEDVATGKLFPPFSRIMDVSADIMAHLLAEIPSSEGGPKRTREEWRAVVKSRMWQPPSVIASKL